MNDYFVTFNLAGVPHTVFQRALDYEEAVTVALYKLEGRFPFASIQFEKVRRCEEAEEMD